MQNKKFHVTGVLYFGMGKPRMYIKNRTVEARDEADAAEQLEQQYGGKWISGPTVTKIG